MALPMLVLAIASSTRPTWSSPAPSRRGASWTVRLALGATALAGRPASARRVAHSLDWWRRAWVCSSPDGRCRRIASQMPFADAARSLCDNLRGRDRLPHGGHASVLVPRSAYAARDVTVVARMRCPAGRKPPGRGRGSPSSRSRPRCRSACSATGTQFTDSVQASAAPEPVPDPERLFHGVVRSGSPSPRA